MEGLEQFGLVVLFVDVVHDGGQDWGFDLSHLGGTVFLSYYFIESSETASEGGIKVVFYIVICSG